MKRTIITSWLLKKSFSVLLHEIPQWMNQEKRDTVETDQKGINKTY